MRMRRKGTALGDGTFSDVMGATDDIPREDLRSMLDLYCRRLEELCYPPVPYKDQDSPLAPSLIRGTGRNDALRHAAWMCGEARRFLDQGRKDKAARWVGWIQGVLWTSGVYSLGELRKHNRFM